MLDLGPFVCAVAIDAVGKPDAVSWCVGQGAVGDRAACAVVGEVDRVKGKGGAGGDCGCEEDEVESGVVRVRGDKPYVVLERVR